MTTKGAKPKRVKLARGDLFEFTADDGRLGYGLVIIPGGVLYAAFFKTLFVAPPSGDALLATDIALVGTTMDALFFHDRWTVISHDFPVPSDIPFPNWKLGSGEEARTTDFEGKRQWPMRDDEVALLDYKFSRAPIAFQKAVEALNGVGEWREDYGKLTVEYAKRRQTRT